jgi:uncharacterized protein
MKTTQFNNPRLKKIFKENDVTFIGVFGSVAKGEDSSNSDIDLLVKFSRSKGLLSLVRLERKLSTFFGRKVDLVTEAALSPYLREYILNDVKVIYEQK